MDNSLEGLADRLILLRSEKKRLDELTKKNNLAISSIEEWMINEFIKSGGTTKFSRNGNTFYYTTKVFVSPNKSRKEELYDWLTNNGFDHMVQTNVNTNTLRSAVREMMDDNDGDVPDDIAELVNVYEQPTIGVRKS